MEAWSFGHNFAPLCRSIGCFISSLGPNNHVQCQSTVVKVIQPLKIGPDYYLPARLTVVIGFMLSPLHPADSVSKIKQ